MKKNHRIVSLLLAALMAIGLMTTAFAAEPTINTGKRASLNIYKYDITTASADGACDAESYVSTGLHDDAVIDKLAKYAVQGVECAVVEVQILDGNLYVRGRISRMCGFVRDGFLHVDNHDAFPPILREIRLDRLFSPSTSSSSTTPVAYAWP